KTKMKDVKSKRKHHDDIYRVALHLRWRDVNYNVKNGKRKIKPKNEFIRLSKKKSFQDYINKAEEIKKNDKQKFDKFLKEIDERRDKRKKEREPGNMPAATKEKLKKYAEKKKEKKEKL